MKLRKLEIKDKPYMEEWMNDTEIMACFRMNRSLINDEKILEFISNSFTDKYQHYAIVDDNDEYQGTISLKNIDLYNKNAEYAIVIRRDVISKGVAKKATNLLLDLAFNKLNLHKVYLNVLEDNIRAIRFYEKMGFHLEGEFKDHLYLKNRYYGLKWYGITEDVFNKNTRLIQDNTVVNGSENNAIR